MRKNRLLTPYGFVVWALPTFLMVFAHFIMGDAKQQTKNKPCTAGFIHFAPLERMFQSHIIAGEAVATSG